eukprot:CAMPEP_0195653490 /NCGR_PEP_ID=MMETSP0815-20121206/33421_1 /TAXON_ID=97485 /ORGANISM="Prymnesium parvum, Strain Texoma1" /LENGTH=406 /DNA_ID=CAMNT_0040797651 /DNA_START=128 /DNA_END=1345 /DNA_ORIENTATION=-
MNSLGDLREKSTHRVVDQLLEVSSGLLLITELKSKLLRHLEHVMLALDVFHVRVYHEQEKIEDQIGRGSEDVERFTARQAEAVVQNGVRAAHRLDHLLAQLHRRRERLRVAAEDVAEVDVEQRAVGAQHQVVEVAVAHSENVHGDAVPRAALDERLQHLRLDAVKARAVRGAAAAGTAGCHSGSPVGPARVGGSPERSELEVEALLPQQLVHEHEHLNHQLVLAQIIAAFEDDRVLRRRVRRVRAQRGVRRRLAAGERQLEGEPHGRHGRLEDSRLLRHRAHDADGGVERHHQRALQAAQPGEHAARLLDHRTQPLDALGAALARRLELLRREGEGAHHLLLLLQRLEGPWLAHAESIEERVVHAAAEVLPVPLVAPLHVQIPVQEVGQLRVGDGAVDEQRGERAR